MAEKVRRWLRKGGVSAPLRDNPDYEDEEDKRGDYRSWEDVFEQEVSRLYHGLPCCIR